MNEAAKKVVQNVMLAAVVRIMLLIGTPTMIALLSWFAGSFVALQQTTAVQAAEQARLVSEVRELQEYRRDAYARGSRMQQDVIAIKEMLTRIQNNLDRRN